MPKMPMTVPPQPNPPPVRRRSKLRRMLNLIVRMLMLGIGGTVAAFLGMILAELYPAAKDGNVPLVERVKQESEQIWTIHSRSFADRRFTRARSPISHIRFNPDSNRVSTIGRSHPSDRNETGHSCGGWFPREPIAKPANCRPSCRF
jgi:hypothetical protein